MNFHHGGGAGDAGIEVVGDADAEGGQGEGKEAEFESHGRLGQAKWWGVRKFVRGRRGTPNAELSMRNDECQSCVLRLKSKLHICGVLWWCVLMSKAIDETECENLLGALPGWEVVNGELVKEFSFGAYLDGVEFAKRCGELAEEMNHHPDLLIRWRKVRVSIVTHSAGGLTELDFEYARRVENSEQ